MNTCSHYTSTHVITYEHTYDRHNDIIQHTQPEATIINVN